MNTMLLTEKKYLIDIADAIREKTGKANPMSLLQMPDEIANISGGNNNQLTPICQVRIEEKKILEPLYYHSEPLQPLPEEISAFPYAVILQENDGTFRLMLSDNRYYLINESDGAQKLHISGSSLYFDHSAIWCPTGARSTPSTYRVNGTYVWNVWWSNFDIPWDSPDGTDIFWHATDPQLQQPAETSRSFYNGKLLPKIPEGIESEYPYIFIAVTGSGIPTLYAFSTIPYWYPTTTYPNCMKASGAGVQYKFSESQEAWEFVKDHASMYGIFANGIAWANYNIPNGSETASTIYLYATQPVPEL